MKKNNSIPQVSIIIPVYNNFELTKNCIDSINNAELQTSYEIIIADDGSSDETINIEKYYNNVRLIKTPKNSGFLLNVKNAASYAKGAYIFLMNNDMTAKPKFLDYLYNTISKNEKIGVIGAMMLNEDDTIQEAGGSIYNDGTAEWNYYGRSKINTKKIYNADYCSGCGIMFSKKDWDKLGGFDERFSPAYYEDVDFCFQIKYILKKKIVCCPKAQIYHFHGKTYKSSASVFCGQNRSKFLEKWGDKLHKTRKEQCIRRSSFLENIFSLKNSGVHKVVTFCGLKLKIKSKKLMKRNSITGSSFQESDINKVYEQISSLNIKLDNVKFIHKKDMYKQKAVLFIDYEIFMPDTNAGDRASFSYLKALCSKGYIVYFLPDNVNISDRDKYIEMIKQAGAEIIMHPDGINSTEYAFNWLKENGSLFDYVYVNRPDIYEKYREALDNYVSKAEYIYNGCDIHFLRLQRMKEIEPENVKPADIENFKNLEISIWRKMDVILYYSDKEIEIVKSYCPNANAFAVPLFLYSDIEKINYNPAERKDLLFIGGFNHHPNADAMRWFIKDILPVIIKSNPDIKLHIAGSNCPQDIIDAANEHIIIHGYLSDDELQNLYNKTKIVIAPLRYGAGIKGKIIEALKNQIPVVTTSIGKEGINFDSLTFTDNSADFAEAVLNLYDDNEKLIQISEKSYEFIKNNFSEDCISRFMEYINV